MSKRINIRTGERMMTEKNALRHYLSRARKVRERNDYDEMRRLYNEALDVIDVDICYKCSEDDFGYCGLRGNRSTLSEEEKFKTYCFNGFIRDMEHMLGEE